MANVEELRFTIGQGRWIEVIQEFTAQIAQDYWHAFEPVSIQEVAKVANALHRQLPDDFCQFLTTFGAGSFPSPFFGRIYTPAEMYEACHGPMLMFLGSARWASDEDQREMYRTHGAFNPAPDIFTAETLVYHGINLLDLLQIGTDGSCCYHELYVGEEPSPFGYCRLTPEQSMVDQGASFSDGLRMILTDHWKESRARHEYDK